MVAWLVLGLQLDRLRCFSVSDAEVPGQGWEAASRAGSALICWSPSTVPTSPHPFCSGFPFLLLGIKLSLLPHRWVGRITILYFIFTIDLESSHFPTSPLLTLIQATIICQMRHSRSITGLGVCFHSCPLKPVLPITASAMF